MAQFYTLDEAATRLGMPADEFKRRLKTDAPFQAIRPFRDGPTLRFRAADIDELARALGAASDPGFPLGAVGSDPAESADDMIFSLAPASGKMRTAPADDAPLVVSDDADDIFGNTRKPAGGSDSDVRLDVVAPPVRGYDPDANNQTEELTLDVSGPGSAVIKPSGLSGKVGGKSSGRLTGPNAGKAARKPDDSSSEFELSVDPTDDSFEFTLSNDSDDEVDLSGMGSPANKAGQSGINLNKPADSGVSLEKGSKTGPLGKNRPPADSDSDIDFELSLDPASPASSARLAGPKTNSRLPAPGPASDSEFELTLDDNSGVADALAADAVAQQPAEGVYETDFELPAMDDDSGADLVSVSVDDADSEEFDVAVDAEDAGDAVELEVDEGDAVMVVDEDEASQPVASRSARSNRRTLDDALDTGDEDLDDRPEPSRRGAAPEPVAGAPAPWGPLPAIVLLLTLPLMFLGAIMSYEVVQSMLGYKNSASPGNALVRGVAGTLIEKPAD